MEQGPIAIAHKEASTRLVRSAKQGLPRFEQEPLSMLFLIG